MSSTILARPFITDPSILGEGIQWRDADQRLYWTDIHGRRFLSAAADGSDYRVIETPERLGSFAFDPDGSILAAFETGLYVYDPATGAKRAIAPFEVDKPTTRMNDGRCDRTGRFLSGGIDEDGLKPISSVMSFDGKSPPRTVINQVSITNSIAFSPDGSVMYFTDTPKRTIFAFDYDQGAGALSNRRVLVEMAPDEGFPDGTCVDAQGRLWNAQFNGGRVQCFLPDGSRGPTVYLPCPQVTCACFGGSGLNTLYITTAREHMSDEDLTKAPLSGAVFAVDALTEFGAVGLPEAGFAVPLSSL